MSEKPLWDARKSTLLSIAVGWIGLLAGIACLGLLIPYLRSLRIPGTVFNDFFVTRAAGPLFGCLIFGIAALIILLRLLVSIRKGEVFTVSNVRRLRLISYCGFAIMAACIVAVIITPIRLVFVFLAAIAGFMGLLMRVIKNVIDAARLLKEDADFTI